MEVLFQWRRKPLPFVPLPFENSYKLVIETHFTLHNKLQKRKTPVRVNTGFFWTPLICVLVLVPVSLFWLLFFMVSFKIGKCEPSNLILFQDQLLSPSYFHRNFRTGLSISAKKKASGILFYKFASVFNAWFKKHLNSLICFWVPSIAIYIFI